MQNFICILYQIFVLQLYYKKGEKLTFLSKKSDNFAKYDENLKNKNPPNLLIRRKLWSQLSGLN